MVQLYRNAVSIAHKVISTVVTNGDVVVDGTAGNGKDTLFLAQLVGEEGTVFAFDIQEEALERTKDKLIKAGLISRVKLIQSGHETMEYYVKSPVKAVIFNLGYLPGGDKTIITKPDTTLEALKQALKLLQLYGIVSLTVYTGHPGGSDEWMVLKNFLERLDRNHYDVLLNRFLNRESHSPFNVIIQKLVCNEPWGKGTL